MSGYDTNKLFSSLDLIFIQSLFSGILYKGLLNHIIPQSFKPAKLFKNTYINGSRPLINEVDFIFFYLVHGVLKE